MKSQFFSTLTRQIVFSKKIGVKLLLHLQLFSLVSSPFTCRLASNHIYERTDRHHIKVALSERSSTERVQLILYPAFVFIISNAISLSFLTAGQYLLIICKWKNQSAPEPHL